MLPDFLNGDHQGKLEKLKKMKLIATGSLVLMAVVYIVFKRYEAYSIIFSFIAAFAEAAMIGALADWFAVIALFRHPLGMKWLPHTAVIQRERDRIGESLAEFVVSNFFTDDIIKTKLDNIQFSERILSYFVKNKGVISKQIAVHLADFVQPVLNSSQFSEVVNSEIKSKIRDIKLHPLISSILPAIVSTELYIPMIIEVLENANNWVKENKEKTIKIIEGINNKFSLPFVGNIIYKLTVNTLTKLIEDMRNGTNSEFTQEILHNLPEKFINDFAASEKAKEKVEKFKNDILDSDLFNNFISSKISEIMESILLSSKNLDESKVEKVINLFDSILDDLFNDSSNKERFNDLIKDSIAKIIAAYRQSIAALISDTIKGWPMDDLVEKLEIQVGGDLQYIRINGTVIGGLAGLVIHAFTLLF